MVKRRVSMVDAVKFPTKAKQVLGWVVNSDVPNAERDVNGQFVPIEQIQLPERQPRHYFSVPAMDRLMVSIREHGILQPLLVRPLPSPAPSPVFELVAGERRYRAAQALGLLEVPVIIRDLTDSDAIQVALLENLQREDLNPVEETEAVLELLALRLAVSPDDVVSLLHYVANRQKQGIELTNNVVRRQWEQVEQVFTVLGRLTPDSFRSHRLPLLSLPEDVLTALRQGQLTYTKARAVAQIKDEALRQALLAEVLREQLSCREIKQRVQMMRSGRSTSAIALPSRMKQVYHQIQRTKIWEDPKKAKALEQLLGQLESLVGLDNAASE